MASDLLLPLFPLEAALLPSERLPLHIFEERYKLMIGEAIEQASEFGVVLAKESSLVNVGCTAKVEEVSRRYPDGRLDIVTRGQRRFEILFLDEKMAYLRGAVHFFDDEDATPPPPDDARRLAGLMAHARRVLPPAAEVSREDAPASFQAAASLPLDLEVKQRLLSMRSETERTAMLTEILVKLLPRLERTRKVEQVSRGNGKGR